MLGQRIDYVRPSPGAFLPYPNRYADFAGMFVCAAELVGRLASSFVELAFAARPMRMRLARAWHASRHAEPYPQGDSRADLLCAFEASDVARALID
ncbi:hypothetical protein [Caballeronia sp. LZ001]|nr:hypothetical protein [Caballeronia sp. LZ001]MDR5801114.1 hypothetical protein [Caballeronia sp. LZ001]